MFRFPKKEILEIIELFAVTTFASVISFFVCLFTAGILAKLYAQIICKYILYIDDTSSLSIIQE